MASRGQDCRFYYYGSCKFGARCRFRHCAAALGNEEICSLWKEGRCTKDMCPLRHTTAVTSERRSSPCFFENQPSGCLKPNCPYQHSKPRPSAAAAGAVGGSTVATGGASGAALAGAQIVPYMDMLYNVSATSHMGAVKTAAVPTKAQPKCESMPYGPCKYSSVMTVTVGDECFTDYSVGVKIEKLAAFGDLGDVYTQSAQKTVRLFLPGIYYMSFVKVQGYGIGKMDFIVAHHESVNPVRVAQQATHLYDSELCDEIYGDGEGTEHQMLINMIERKEWFRWQDTLDKDDLFHDLIDEDDDEIDEWPAVEYACDHHFGYGHQLFFANADKPREVVEALLDDSPGYVKKSDKVDGLHMIYDEHDNCVALSIHTESVSEDDEIGIFGKVFMDRKTKQCFALATHHVPYFYFDSAQHEDFGSYDIAEANRGFDIEDFLKD